MTQAATTASGNLARSSSWILSCTSWMQQGCYIVLPINPSQLSFDLGIRTTNELARAAQLIYVWRFFGSSSTLVKPTINVTANSGYIVPSFDPSIVTDCMELVWSRTAAARGKAAQDSNVPLQTQVQMYDTALTEFAARLPAPEQTKDYIKDGVYQTVGAQLRPNASISDTGLVGNGNMPDLYTEENKHVPIGVQNLYAMFSLADERRITKVLRTGDKPDSPSGGQTGNRIMLIISTPVFPRLVVYGWFGESGIKYTENAEEPGSFDMTFDIVVDETVPKLGFGGWNDLMTTYVNGINATGTTLDFAKAQL